jgi:flagellar protein FlbD
LIILSRLNGSVVAINPDLITWIDITPDTTVSLVGGDKIIVREPLGELIDRVIEFRRAVGVSAAAVADAALERIELANRDGSGIPATSSPPRSSGASEHPSGQRRSQPPVHGRSIPPVHGQGSGHGRER